MFNQVFLLLFTALTCGYAFTNLTFTVPFTEKCSYEYYFHHFLPEIEKNYFLSNLQHCMENKTEMLTLQDASVLYRHLNASFQHMLSFYVNNHFGSKFVVVQMFPLQVGGFGIDVRLSRETRYVTHVGCIDKVNCTSRNDVLIMVTQDSAMITFICFVIIFVITILISFCALFKNLRQKYKQKDEQDSSNDVSSNKE